MLFNDNSVFLLLDYENVNSTHFKSNLPNKISMPISLYAKIFIPWLKKKKIFPFHPLLLESKRFLQQYSTLSSCPPLILTFFIPAQYISTYGVTRSPCVDVLTVELPEKPYFCHSKLSDDIGVA